MKNSPRLQKPEKALKQQRRPSTTKNLKIKVKKKYIYIYIKEVELFHKEDACAQVRKESMAGVGDL